MKLDTRYRASIAPLLDGREQLLAAPVTGAWISGSAVHSGLAGGAAKLARPRGVAGRLVEAAGLSMDDLSLHDELVAATQRRLLFLAGSRVALRRRARRISDCYPLGEVTLSWADATIKGRRWRAFCFHLPDGSWWALESNRGAAMRPPTDDESDLMVRAFAERAHQVRLQ